MSTDVALRQRVRHGLRRPANWLELVRFAVVGASGYVVNLAVFTALVKGAGQDYRLGATLAFAVALANNFLWNRRWTFRAHEGAAHQQGLRFVLVSLAAFLLGLVVLHLLVRDAGISEVPAQALSIVLATPLSFLGNKLWSFAS